MKVYWESGGTAPRILRHSMEVSGQIHASVTLPLGKESPVPVE